MLIVLLPLCPPTLFAFCLHFIIITFRFTAVFNNMRTLKFKPTSQDAFFAAVNQISGGFRLLPTATGKARGLSNKHGSQIWIFFAVESGVFACDSSSLSRGDSSLVESRKNICS